MKNANSVSIVPAENGAMVRAYQNSPEFGFVQLQTVSVTFNGDWLSEQKRTHLMKGSTQLLEQWINVKASNGTLPGVIAVHECLEDDIPAHLAKRLQSDITFEEAIEPFLKRAGKDGDVLTKDGKRILRFTIYSPTDLADVRVQHDATPEQ